ncbi:hypothetical protein EJB05_04082, partial [Eragrostis curvula]
MTASSAWCGRGLCNRGRTGARVWQGFVQTRAHWGKSVATATVKRMVATVFGEMNGQEHVQALVDLCWRRRFTREAVLRKCVFIKGAVKDNRTWSCSASSIPTCWSKPQTKSNPTTTGHRTDSAPMAEVTLRRFELSDVDAMMAWASDPQVAAFCRWEPYASTDPLLAYLRDTVLPHPWFRAICLAGESRPVGAVSVAPTAERCRGELGYVLARAHWGKGVATAAVRRALRAVFAEVDGLERVEALVDVDNPASQRVAEKAGLRREGVLRRHYWHKGRARDMVMYSFISSDPLPE